MSIITNLKRVASITIAAALIATSSLAAISGIAAAAVSNPVPKAQISFTFDDGMQSAYTQAAPALKKYGMTGVSYVTTNCIGMTTVPNTCKAEDRTPYMTWAQVKALQTTYGWEIGSHTVSHPLLASADPEMGQPAKLTPAQMDAELKNSKAALSAQGINATAFASPYGDYDAATLAVIAKYYTSHRGFADNANNTWPHSDYLLYNMPVQTGVTVAAVKSRIDQAIAKNQWLVLTMHDIKVTPSTNPDDYQYKTADLEAIAAYVKSKQDSGLVRNVNVSKGLVAGALSDNLMPNFTFDIGINGGWRTNNPSAVALNTASNGAFPSPVSSIRFAPSATAGRLISPMVPVNANSEYVLKNYLRVQNRTAGAMEFYIDEYDVNGKWISGQFKRSEATVWTASQNFAYKPTSPSVTKASLQITNTAGSGITAYLDNVQWFPTKTSTPPATQTNLVGNGTFDAGISGGWRSDNAAALTADATSKGSPNNVVNSVRFQAGTANAHLFSPMVAVDPARTYTMSSYLKLNTLTSNEIGFYVDEYDAAGNWISGQYKIGVRTVSTGDISFAYMPSSAAVAKSSLQFIVPANSGAAGYYDDVRWFVNP
jgi:peptidoglycan/xylan/chitin deacetylase (PgdA/CDA1 family)